MTTDIALPRAVNVGGTGKLPMATLKAFREEAGLLNVRTSIASGKVVFDSQRSATTVRSLPEARLAAHAGRKVDVLVRSADEMAAVVAADPFAGRPGNRTVAIFLDQRPPSDAIGYVVARKDEELVLGVREIDVFFGDGMAASTLRIPATKTGTARNMNTMATLAEMAVA